MLGLRLVAFILDNVVVFLLGVLISLFLFLMGADQAVMDSPITIFICFCVSVAYFAQKRTIGQEVCGLVYPEMDIWTRIVKGIFKTIFFGLPWALCAVCSFTPAPAPVQNNGSLSQQ